MDFTNGRYKNIIGSIAVVKLGAVIFASIILANQSFAGTTLMKHPEPFYSSIVFVVLVILLALVYLLWSFTYVKMYNTKYFSKLYIIGDFIFIFFISFFIFTSNVYSNQCQYKYLFFFSILSTTISFGKKHGLITSYLVSIIVLLIDLIFTPTTYGVNMYFENDIMLSIGFIVVAWILGDYVKYEKNQRESLEQEVMEQMKEHAYIEELLLKNESCYNLLIKQSPDAIFIHSNNEIKYLNENALQLIGVSSLGEIKEKSISDFKYLGDKLELKEKYLHILNNKKTQVSFEEKIINNKGDVINILNTSTYCLYGKTPSVLTIMRDITHEKQVETLKEDVEKNIKLLNESQEYNKFITEFFSNISHELKTPINVIFSSLQLMMLYNENSEPEYIQKKEKYLNSMKKNCYRLTRLINNILDMTKLDAGFIKPKMANGDIVSSVEDIAMSIVPHAESKGVDIIFDTDIEEKIMAFDEDKLERIILNLLSNALKFTNRGGRILVNIFDKGGDTIDISVKDTGIGIPKDMQKLIFERFGQVDKTLKRNREGTGIGLSLVKSFVELHGGHVKLISELNKGSEFIITIPSKEILGASVHFNEIKNNMEDRVTMELSDIYLDAI